MLQIKDITITAKQIKGELILFLVCFLIGFVINFIAIIWYGSNWSELFTSLHYVIVFGLFLYAIWSGIRFLLLLLKRIFQKPKTKTV